MIIDVTRLLRRKFLERKLLTGVDRVDYEYVKKYSSGAIALVRLKFFWVTLSKRHSDQLFTLILSEKKVNINVLRWIIIKGLLTSVGLKKLQGKQLLNISHSGLDTIKYEKKVKQYNLKPIYFVHDLIPIRFPEYVRLGENERHKRRINHAIKFADSIILNSHETYRDLSEFGRENRLFLPKMKVAHLGISSSIYRSDKIILDTNYFVILGTIEPRKNHWVLLHVWREIIGILGDQSPTLVIIGEVGWDSEHVMHFINQCDIIKDYIIHEVSCDDQKLSQYLSHARALLFPSFYEGYGIPLIEALSIKTPVIASDLAVFHELVNDIPEYIHPLDAEGWKRMIIEYTSLTSEKRIGQVERLENLKSFKWEQHFNKIDTLFRNE